VFGNANENGIRSHYNQFLVMQMQMETAQELNLDDEKLDLAICRLNFATRSLIWWQQMKLEVQLPSNCCYNEIVH
jgi:hypothetical protein